MSETAEVKNPRNSQWRTVFAQPVNSSVAALAEHFPNLSPNTVTILGTAMLGVLSGLTAELEKRQQLTTTKAAGLLIGYGLSNATDALDGGLARHKIANGKLHNSENGQLVDAVADRIQEAITVWIAMYRAYLNGDKPWLLLASLQAITNPLSSFLRAYAEKHGITVPESGKSPLDVFGTRLGRAFGGSLAYIPHIPIGPTSVQAIHNGLGAAANIKVGAQRLEAVRTANVTEPDPSPETTKLQKDAEKRFLALGITLLATSITTLGLLRYFTKQSK